MCKFISYSGINGLISKANNVGVVVCKESMVSWNITQWILDWMDTRCRGRTNVAKMELGKCLKNGFKQAEGWFGGPNLEVTECQVWNLRNISSVAKKNDAIEWMGVVRVWIEAKLHVVFANIKWKICVKRDIQQIGSIFNLTDGYISKMLKLRWQRSKELNRNGCHCCW